MSWFLRAWDFLFWHPLVAGVRLAIRVAFWIVLLAAVFTLVHEYGPL